MSEIKEQIVERLREAVAKVKAMSPAEYAAMIDAQRQSFARSMAPCEHGIADWEDCSECRRSALNATPQDGKGGEEW